MPETNKDKRKCYKCNTAYDKKMKKCKVCQCHAVTYCGKECQVADWPRDKEKCIPVMVKEIEGKGRGLVAAKDIKMGEEILLDKMILKIPDGVITSTVARELKQQIQALSDEESTQFYNLKTVDNVALSSRDLKVLRRENCLRELKIFRSNKVEVDKKEMLFFHFALINHSCAPNADYHYMKPDENADQKKDEGKFELRAIKDIW